MKKIKVLSLILSLIMMFSCMGIVLSQADEIDDTLPPVTEDTGTYPDDTEPDYSDPDNTDSTDPDDTEPDNTDSTDSEDTEPTETEETEPTEEETERPTEYEEEPATYSDYQSPAPAFTPGEQDYSKQEWVNLSLDVSNKTNNTGGGPGSFANIKKDTSTGDKTNPTWIILCIVFWCLSLACITMAILYNNKSKAKSAPATRSASSRTSRPTSSSRTSSRPQDRSHNSSRSSSSRPTSGRYEKKYSDYDDYNDGF